MMYKQTNEKRNKTKNRAPNGSGRVGSPPYPTRTPKSGRVSGSIRIKFDKLVIWQYLEYLAEY